MVLGCQTCIRKVSRKPIPFTQPSVIKHFQFIRDNERNNAMVKAFLKHDKIMQPKAEKQADLIFYAKACSLHHSKEMVKFREQKNRLIISVWQILASNTTKACIYRDRHKPLTRQTLVSVKQGQYIEKSTCVRQASTLPPHAFGTQINHWHDTERFFWRWYIFIPSIN